MKTPIKRSDVPRSSRFLRGKKSEQLLTRESEDRAPKDPEAQAAAVAVAWGASVDAIIRTGVLIAETLRAFASDPNRLDAFIIALVDRGVLTSHEARRRLAAPKLVKLRMMGASTESA